MGSNCSGYELFRVSYFGLRLVSDSEKIGLEPIGLIKFFKLYSSLVHPAL